VLLGLAIAYPGMAGDVFADLRRDGPFEQVLYERSEGSEGTRRRRGIPDLAHGADLGLGDAAGSFAEWAEVVAAFSFHPWRQ